MKKHLFTFALIALLACQKQEKNIAMIEKKQPKVIPVIQQNTYSFDSTAGVGGCADILLQKISKDKQYELRVDLEFDSVPKK